MIAAVAAVVVAVSLSAPSHQVGLSRGLYTQTAEGVDLELVLARGEAARTVAGLDVDHSGTVEDRELNAAAAMFATDVVDQIVVTSEGHRCAGSFQGASLTEEDGLAVRAHYACDKIGKTAVDFELVKRLSTGHRHLAHVVTTDGAADYVAFASSTTFAFGADAPPPSRFEFVKLGVEHILTGFDHL